MRWNTYFELLTDSKSFAKWVMLALMAVLLVSQNSYLFIYLLHFRFVSTSSRQSNRYVRKVVNALLKPFYTVVDYDLRRLSVWATRLVKHNQKKKEWPMLLSSCCISCHPYLPHTVNFLALAVTSSPMYYQKAKLDQRHCRLRRAIAQGLV